MLISEENARDAIRNRDGRRVFYLGKNDQLTSGAKDFLARERIPVLPAEKARPERFRLLNGGYVEDKPEHMTHLDGQTMVIKTHPRIRFRGKLDTLESELLLCQAEGAAFHRELGEILGFVRKLLRCEVMGEPFVQSALMGMTEAELRRRSHFPQEAYSQPHFMPEASDGMEILRLNRARTAAREAELAAVEAFTDRDGAMTRGDLIQAMNRVSSALYILMIRCKAGKEGKP